MVTKTGTHGVFSRLCHRVRASARRRLHPRAIVWRYYQKYKPQHSITTTLRGELKVRIHPCDVIGEDIFVNGVFERLEADFVVRYLRSGGVFIDAGANLGQYTLLAASKVGPRGQVHSFEPSARMFSELQHNVKLNGFDGWCTLNCVALSDTLGTAVLSRFEPGAEVYGSLATRPICGKSIIGEDEVVTVTLDSYLEEHGVGRVDLIKMDIEGAELLALRGSHRLLSGPSAPAIVLEMADSNTAGFGYSAIEIWNYLSKLDYRFYTLGRNLAPILEPPDFSAGVNLVAIRDDLSSLASV